MSCNNHNAVAISPVVRALIALSLTLAALCAPPAAFALDSGDIVVTSLKGEVHVTVNGAARAMKTGGVLETPASIRTGRDGSIDLKQGATTVSVGPDTLLEFSALEKRGAAIDRVVQPRGNAFYSIGKRDGRKLRVETPYLVGVVKGTQFNVAAQDDATTISLFEGRLEVRASDDSDVVDLNAGEIATRKRGDKSITVMKMDGKAPTNAPRPSSSGNGGGEGSPAPMRPVRNDEDSVVADRGVSVTPVVSTTVDTVGDTPAKATVSLDVRTNAAELNTGVSVGANVGGSGVSADVGAGVSVVPVGVDATTTTSVDVAPGAVDLATSTAVDAGPVTADVGATTSVDVGTGGIAADVDTGATTGVDAGVSTAVDVGAGTVDLGLSVAGVDLGAAVDPGLDDTTTTTDTTTDTTAPIVDVGGLLDGLVNRRPK